MTYTVQSKRLMDELLKMKPEEYNNITTLKIVCDDVSSLLLDQPSYFPSVLPKNLNKLIVEHANISCLPKLPESLKELHLIGTKMTYVILPRRLERLVLLLNRIERLVNLPPTIRDLAIDDEYNLTGIKLPPSLRKFSIRYCGKVSNISLNSGLQDVRIYHNGVLDELRVPSSVTNLILTSENTRVRIAKHSKLTNLHLCGGRFTNLGNIVLPDCMNSITLINIHNNRYMPPLPKKLVALVAVNCNFLSLPKILPPFLEEIKITECDEISSIPLFPKTIKNVNIYRCPKIRTVPFLPRSIKELQLYCLNLDEYPPTCVIPQHHFCGTKIRGELYSEDKWIEEGGISYMNLKRSVNTVSKYFIAKRIQKRTALIKDELLFRTYYNPDFMYGYMQERIALKGKYVGN